VALGIPLGVFILAYAVLLACRFAPIVFGRLFFRRQYGFGFVKADDAETSLQQFALSASFAFVYLIVLGIIYLSAEWRVYAAIVATPLVFGALLWTFRAGANCQA
jgi:hypothetical protein